MCNIVCNCVRSFDKLILHTFQIQIAVVMSIVVIMDFAFMSDINAMVNDSVQTEKMNSNAVSFFHIKIKIIGS